MDRSNTPPPADAGGDNHLFAIDCEGLTVYVAAVSFLEARRALFLEFGEVEASHPIAIPDDRTITTTRVEGPVAYLDVRTARQWAARPTGVVFACRKREES
jgi:hypothetical protein